MKGKNTISVYGETKSFSQEGGEVQKILQKALAFLKEKDLHLDLFLVSTKGIQEVNKISRGKDAPTTVISFPDEGVVPYPETEKKHIGEIYLAPRVISKKGDSIFHLAIHGLLHLLGYTHSQKRDSIEMERIEEEILSSLE